jgi:hypothetical protein
MLFFFGRAETKTKTGISENQIAIRLDVSALEDTTRYYFFNISFSGTRIGLCT